MRIMEKSLSVQYDPKRPVSLLKTLGILRRGLGDPTIRLSATEAWLAFATPLGDASLHLHKPSTSSPAALQAWGPGAQWALESAPNLLGALDDWSDFDQGIKEGRFPQIVARTRLEHPDAVLPTTGRIFEHAAGAILEQRVTGIEANHAWRWIIRHLGHRAPGPVPEGLMIFPEPHRLASMKRWDWQKARVEAQRAKTMGRLVQVAHSLQWWAGQPIDQVKPAAMPPGTLTAALASVPGIGPWTIAETLQRSHGAGDFISVGDYHLADFVGQVLTGKRISDSQMLELLAPYAPHRQRVVRMLMLSGQKKQSFGPRYAPLDHRRR